MPLCFLGYGDDGRAPAPLLLTISRERAIPKLLLWHSLPIRSLSEPPHCSHQAAPFSNQQEERGGGEEAAGTWGGAGPETKWKKKMIPYSRRPSLQYFSGHVKKHRYLPPRNPSHQLGSRHGGGGDREAHTQHSQNTISMMKIIEKLRGIMEVKELGKSESHIEEEDKADEMSLPHELHSAGELFLPKPDTDLFSLGRFWSAPKDQVFPWELHDTTMEKKLEKEERIKRVNAPTLADLIIPPPELKRLRTLGISLQNPVKVGRLGITSNIAHSIMQRWRHSELVKVKCQGPAAENMLKIHRDLEVSSSFISRCLQCQQSEMMILCYAFYYAYI